MAKPQRGLNENRIARLARSQGLMLRPSGRMFVLLNNGGGGGHAFRGSLGAVQDWLLAAKVGDPDVAA